MKRGKYISADWIYRVITIFVVTTILFAIYGSYSSQNWEIFFTSIVVLIILPIPMLFEKKFKFQIPTEIEIIFLIFIYLSLFIGKARGFYDLFWWWDVLLHSMSALILGFIGFTIIYLMYSSHKIKARPIALAIFSFTFAIAIGAVWEIFEFFMDQVFGLNMQYGSLIDTMSDLVIDALGAIVASTIGFFYFSLKRAPPFERLIENIRKNNPSWFGK